MATGRLVSSRCTTFKVQYTLDLLPKASGCAGPRWSERDIPSGTESPLAIRDAERPVTIRLLPHAKRAPRVDRSIFDAEWDIRHRPRSHHTNRAEKRR